MKKILSAVLLLSCAFSALPAFAQVVSSDLVIPSVTSETVLVKFKDSIDVDSSAGTTVVDETADSIGSTVTDTLPEANAVLIETDSLSASDAAAILTKNPDVEYAEPNYARTPSSLTTNDKYHDYLWALSNSGQSVPNAANNGSTSGTPGDDIDAVRAWTLSEGTSSLVAVIDSGVFYTHEDLAANMWNGATCVDDQGAVLGGCIHGYDFADNDLNPLPDASSTSYYHGTEVAGIIAAQKNNGKGTVGIAPQTKIMDIRFGFDVASEVRAIDFARLNGAKIINASYGGEDFSQAEYDAIKRFTDAGGIMVAAAGNYAYDNDAKPLYPASYDLPGIISVAATDQNDTLATFSSYGATTVDLGAPGVNIADPSVINNDLGTLFTSYSISDGTSMATPYVAGTVALIESLYPTRSANDIKNDILTTGSTSPSLIGKTVTGKRLNAYRALLSAGGADFIAPVITLTGASTITLTVGDTYTEQGATVYDAIDASTTVAIGGDVISTTTPAGTYHITYDAIDASSNHATQVVRTVIVVAPAPVVVPVSNPAPSDEPSYSGGGGGGGGGSFSQAPIKTVTPTPIFPGLVLGASTTTVASSSTSISPIIPRPPQNPSFIFTRTLRVGSRGADVTALQLALTRGGFFTAQTTTYFGSVTAAALRAYQKSHGLEAVGYTGPKTRAMLNSGQ